VEPSHSEPISAKTRLKVLGAIWRSVGNAQRPSVLPKPHPIAEELKENESSVSKAFKSLLRDFRIVRRITLSEKGAPSFVYDITLLGLVELLQSKGSVVKTPRGDIEVGKFTELVPAIFSGWRRLENAGLAALAWETFTHVCRLRRLPKVEEAREFQEELHTPFGVLYKTRPELLVEAEIYENFYRIVLQIEGPPPVELGDHPAQFSKLLAILLEDPKIALLCTFILLKDEVMMAQEAFFAGRDKLRFADKVDSSFRERNWILLKPFLSHEEMNLYIDAVKSKLREFGLDLTMSPSNVARKLVLNESPFVDEELVKSGETIEYAVSELKERFGEDFEDELENWLNESQVRPDYVSLLKSLGLKTEADLYNLKKPEDQARVMAEVFMWILKNARRKSPWKRLARKQVLDLRKSWLFRTISLIRRSRWTSSSKRRFADSSSGSSGVT